MSDPQEPISIEASNGWFFALLLSLATPWIFLPDRIAIWGILAVFTFWALVALWWMRKEHIVFKAWLAGQDEATVRAAAANRRMGSIRQGAAREELARRQASSHAASA